MDGMIATQSAPFRKARLTNYNTTFPTLIPKTAEPTSADASSATAQVAIPLAHRTGGPIQNAVLICPYGLHASVDNKTMKMRVVGWRQVGVGGASPDTALWIPVTLCEVLCTLSGTQIGVASMTLIATEGFADTITLTTGNANVSVDVNSPADNTIAHILVDMKGFQMIEPIFDTNSSSTSMNALLAFL